MKKILYTVSLLSLIFCLANCASTASDEALLEESGQSATSDDAVKTADSAATADAVDSPVTASPPSEPPPSEPVNCLTTQHGGCPDVNDLNQPELGFHHSNGH